jgi:hypothetical protein
MAAHQRVLLASTLISLLAIASLVSRADDSHARMVRISYVQGDIRLNSQSVTLNMPIVEGNTLVTAGDSLAEVQFEDGSTVRLAPQTQITFSQLARLGSGDAITRIDLDQGEAEFSIAKPTAGLFAVEVHNKNVLFKQAGRFRVLSTNSIPLELAVWKGSAAVHDRDSGQDVEVEKNETFILAADDAEKYDLEEGVVADELDHWSQSRETYLAGSGVSSVNNSVSPFFGSSAFGFGDPCQPYYWNSGYLYPWQPYWVSATPGSCFSSFFFYPPPFYGYLLAPIFPGPRRPRIHPPVPPVAAAAIKLGSATASVTAISSGRRPPARFYDEDSFKRDYPPQNNGEEQAHREGSRTSGGSGVETGGKVAPDHHASSRDSRHTSQSAPNHSPYARSSGASSSPSSSSSGSGSRGLSGSSSSFSHGSSSGSGSSSHSSSGSSGGRGR